jgi:hypothetical protein
MPVQWFAKDQKFVEWHHRASVKPGSGDFWADDAWQWQLKCAGCHTTGLALNYDSEARRYDTRWRELAIGCESCHGPGRQHAESPTRRGKIICPSDLTNKQQLETCGKCHSRGTAGPDQGAPAGLPGRIAYPYNMIPGADLDAHYVQVTPDKNPKEFWKDSSSYNHHQQLTDHRIAYPYTRRREGAPLHHVPRPASRRRSQTHGRGQRPLHPLPHRVPRARGPRGPHGARPGSDRERRLTLRRVPHATHRPSRGVGVAPIAHVPGPRSEAKPRDRHAGRLHPLPQGQGLRVVGSRSLAYLACGIHAAEVTYRREVARDSAGTSSRP